MRIQTLLSHYLNCDLSLVPALISSSSTFSLKMLCRIRYFTVFLGIPCFPLYVFGRSHIRIANAVCLQIHYMEISIKRDLKTTTTENSKIKALLGGAHQDDKGQ